MRTRATHTRSTTVNSLMVRDHCSLILVRILFCSLVCICSQSFSFLILWITPGGKEGHAARAGPSARGVGTDGAEPADIPSLLTASKEGKKIMKNKAISIIFRVRLPGSRGCLPCSSCGSLAPGSVPRSLSRVSLPEPCLLTRDVPDPGRRARPRRIAAKPPPCPRAARATVPPAEGARLRPSGVEEQDPAAAHGPFPWAERRPLSRDTELSAVTRLTVTRQPSRLPSGALRDPGGLSSRVRVSSLKPSCHCPLSALVSTARRPVPMPRSAPHTRFPTSLWSSRQWLQPPT